MKFTTPAFVALATMATFSLAVPGIVVVDVGAADDNLPSDEPPDDCVTVEKRTGCGHNHCGECNGTGCKMGSGITYPCTRGKVSYFFLSIQPSCLHTYD